MVDPRQPHEVGVGAGDQVGQSAPRQVGGRDAVADVAARPGVAARLVVADRREPVARNADAAAPGVGDLRVACRRKELLEGVLEHGVHPRRLLVGLAHLRVEVIRRAAAAQRDAAVFGSHRVDVEVAAVGERLVAVPADLLPEARRQRLGGEHERVGGHDVAARAGQLGGETLGRPHDDAGTHLAGRGHEPAAVNLEHRCALVNAHPEALDDARQAARETRRVEAGAVYEIRSAPVAGDVDALARLGGVQPHHLVGTHAPLVVPDRLGFNALDLLGAVGEGEHAALVETRIDAFGARDAADLVDRLEHRALHVDGALAAVCPGDGLERRREER